MSRYLTIARSATYANEINEISPSASGVVESRTAHLTGIDGQPSLRLFRGEAVALGLNSNLVWMRVSQTEVEASAPPAGWAGTLPAICGWRSLCQSLGPCPRHLAGGPCRVDGDTP
jgi:hypothetical protein